MHFKNTGAEIFVPDGLPADEAIKRTTHMCISAHQDDVEIMAFDGILKCFGKSGEWFLSVVVTNGAGSSRDGLYAAYTDERMREVRKREQKKAAFIGEYAAAVLMDYPSPAAKDPKNRDIVDEIKELAAAARPGTIYTHNLADKHETHIGVALKAVQALRELPDDMLPEKLFGCEVWRNLDWLDDRDKVVFDVSAHPNLAAALVEVYDSQICGGKRYDLATMGRRLANATYAESHATDASTALIYGMELTPLLKDKNIDITDYVLDHIEKFKNDVKSKIVKMR